MTNSRTLSDDDIDLLLARRGQVAVPWSIEDVHHVRPDLTAEQAWSVLQECKDAHDAEYGFNWTHIECVADQLFPRPRRRKSSACGKGASI